MWDQDGLEWRGTPAAICSFLGLCHSVLVCGNKIAPRQPGLHTVTLFQKPQVCE